MSMDHTNIMLIQNNHGHIQTAEFCHLREFRQLLKVKLNCIWFLSELGLLTHNNEIGSYIWDILSPRNDTQAS